MRVKNGRSHDLPGSFLLSPSLPPLFSLIGLKHKIRTHMINLDSRLLDLLSGEELGLFVHILKRVGKDNKAWPGKDLLQKETRYGREKLSKTIKALIDKNIISRTQENKGKSFGKIVYTIETELAGVYISAKSQSLQDTQRDTETRDTETRDTETRTRSINQSLSINQSKAKIKLHSSDLVGQSTHTLKRTKSKLTKTKLPKTPPKQTKKEKASKYIPYATDLKEIVQSTKNINISGQQLINWADSIRLLHEYDKVSIDRINTAINWYQKHIGEDYVPDVQSGKSFREKFTKLEAAIQRQKRPPKNGNTQTWGSRIGTDKKLDFSKVKYKQFDAKKREYINN